MVFNDVAHLSSSPEDVVENHDMHGPELHPSSPNEGSPSDLYGAEEMDTTKSLKIMVVGDSMTQGHEGDWTWRYRIWEWFRNNHVAIDFVGPYVGTLPPASPAPPALPKLWGASDLPEGPRTSGGYAKGVSPDFDSHHFAVWGRQVAQDKDLIEDLVSRYEPDLLLVMLGFNDMGWFVSDAEGTLESMQAFVKNARMAKSNIRFALADVPQRSFLDGREDLPVKTDQYNAMLKEAIPQWNTQESSIELVHLRENYACDVTGCPAGYDGLHPNALGEYQIASAFSKTLYHGYHMGNGILEVPTSIPERPTPVPANVKAMTSPGGITVTWNAVYGAFGYDVRSRTSGSSDWTVSRAEANRYDSTHTVDGETYQYQVRTNNGDRLKSDWSEIVSAISHPQTAPPPENITAHPTVNGVRVSWTPPTGLTADGDTVYHVVFFDLDAPGSFPGGGGFLESPAHIDGLTPGHHYGIAVETWTSTAGGGPLGFARNVTVGAEMPPVPSNLHATTINETAVRLTWVGSAMAAGYQVWSRQIKDVGPFTPRRGTVSETSINISDLEPESRQYEFCVSAFNGDMESERSASIVAPRITTWNGS